MEVYECPKGHETTNCCNAGWRIWSIGNAGFPEKGQICSNFRDQFFPRLAMPTRGSWFWFRASPADAGREMFQIGGMVGFPEIQIPITNLRSDAEFHGGLTAVLLRLRRGNRFHRRPLRQNTFSYWNLFARLVAARGQLHKFQGRALEGRRIVWLDGFR